MLTEDEELAVALAEAAEHWPHLRRQPSALLHRLIVEGHYALERRPVDRRAAVEATSGSLTGVYPAGYLEQLREEWE